MIDEAIQDIASLLKGFKESLLKDSEELEVKVSKLVVTAITEQELADVEFFISRLERNDAMLKAIDSWSKAASKALNKDIAV